MTSKNKRLRSILLIATLLLSAPMIAMLFTNEVDWKVLDFVVAGALLLGTGLAIELVIRSIKDSRSRIIVISTLIGLLILIWAELAVGIFGSPLAGS